MKFLCLTPLYNHHQRLTQNVYAALQAQRYTDWVWVLGDDRPQHQQLPGILGSDSKVLLKKFDQRCSCMGEKYTEMVRYAEASGVEWNAIAIMDGDDFFTNIHLSQHTKALSDGDFSYPSVCFSTFAGIVQVEPSAGRFFSSIAFTKRGLEKIGGFGDSKIVGFDQQLLGRLRDACGVSDHEVPTYVYRWSDTMSDHTSGHSSGFSCTEWWNRTPVMPAEGFLYPKYDEATEDLILPGVAKIYAERGIF